MTSPKVRILIVEDERIIAADLEENLKDMGYEVCGITGFGEEALELAAEHRPDLVLMDIKLQGAMDGIETAAEMKARFQLPVVYLTAFSNGEILSRAEVAEPFGFLVKPFQPGELRATIHMACYKAGMEKELREAYAKLKQSLAEVKKLSGLLPICTNCKKIRDNQDYWEQVEDYISTHSEAEFTHSICPSCAKKLYPDLDICNE